MGKDSNLRHTRGKQLLAKQHIMVQYTTTLLGFLYPRPVFCLSFFPRFISCITLGEKIFSSNPDRYLDGEIFSKNIFHINHPFHLKGWAAVYTAIILNDDSKLTPDCAVYLRR